MRREILSEHKTNTIQCRHTENINRPSTERTKDTKSVCCIQLVSIKSIDALRKKIRKTQQRTQNVGNAGKGPHDARRKDEKATREQGRGNQEKVAGRRTKYRKQKSSRLFFSETARKTSPAGREHREATIQSDGARLRTSLTEENVTWRDTSDGLSHNTRRPTHKKGQ